MGTATTRTERAIGSWGFSASSWTFARPNDTTAYASGDIIGEGVAANAEFTVTQSGFRGVRITGASLLVNLASFTVAATRLHLFNDAPTALADNVALNVIAADRAKYLGYLDFGEPTDVGDIGFYSLDTLNIIRPLLSAKIYGWLETRAVFTPAANTSFTISLYTLDV